MANEHQYRPRTRIVATRGVREYRDTIGCLVGAEDIVLELGCEWGTTTELLAQQAKHVIGTDVSQVCIDKARKLRPLLHFDVLDAYDVRAALELCPEATKVYVDLSGISGYRSLLDAVSLVNSYSVVLRPDTVVVKSGALVNFARRCSAWGHNRQRA